MTCMDWKRTSGPVIRNGDYRIMRWQWTSLAGIEPVRRYVLWHGDAVVGKYDTAEDAKAVASDSEKTKPA